MAGIEWWQILVLAGETLGLIVALMPWRRWLRRRFADRLDLCEIQIDIGNGFVFANGVLLNVTADVWRYGYSWENEDYDVDVSVKYPVKFNKENGRRMIWANPGEIAARPVPSMDAKQAAEIAISERQLSTETLIYANTKLVESIKSMAKQFNMKWLLIILVVAGLAALGFWYVNNQNQHKAGAVSPSPTPVLTTPADGIPAPVPSPSAGGK